jgi:hypothetical protein
MDIYVMWNDRQPPTSFCDTITGPSCATFYLTLYLLGWFFKTISLDTSTSHVCCSFLVGKFYEWKKKDIKCVEKFVNYCCFFEMVGSSIIPSGGSCVALE